MPVPAPRIEVHDDAADLATAVAGELHRAARGRPGPRRGAAGRADRRRRSPTPCTASWAGCGTELARSTGRRVVVWWGDERFVAPDHPTATPGRPARPASTPLDARPRAGARDALDRRRRLGRRGRRVVRRRHARARHGAVRRGDARRRPRRPRRLAVPGLSRSSTSTTRSPSASPTRPSHRPSGSRLTFAALNRSRRCGSWSAARRRPRPSPAALAAGTDVARHPGRRRQGRAGDDLVPRPRERVEL